MAEPFDDRLDQIAVQWMKLVAAGQTDSAEARALCTEFAALDQQLLARQPATRQAEVRRAAPRVEYKTRPPEPLPAEPVSRPDAGATRLRRRPGRKRALSEFTKGQLAALLAVGLPLRESARLLQISRSTAQRALEDDCRLQGETELLANRIDCGGVAQKWPELPPRFMHRRNKMNNCDAHETTQVT